MATTTHKPLTTPKLTLKSPKTKTAALIYEYSVESANALWAAYDLARVNRGKPRGITTDQEQDILRAMLIAAASGLDASIKQLIRDCLQALLVKEDVQAAFEKFVQRHLQGGEAESNDLSAKVLAKIISAPDPQKQLIDRYVYELTGDSLQSAEQLLKVCAALGVDSKPILGDLKTLKSIFAARNQMIHELDMNLSSPNRKRRVRGQADMQGYAERLIKISAEIVADVDSRAGV
jgi:hypothetical protein